MQLHGQCLCGHVRYTVEGPPLRVHYCHCGMCRRATGGPFAVLAWVKRGHLRWTAQAPALRRSSPIAERGFCSHCGTPLLLSYDGRDDIALTVGSLDDPAHWAPTSHYGVEGRLPWADCGKGKPEAETREAF
jgi:hypothetical protein